ncbi:MAG: hypothetical protein ACI30S_04570 [Muribaculaceae bacterium]
MKRIILTIISILAFSGAYAEGWNNGGNNAIWQPYKNADGTWVGDGNHEKILRVDRGTTRRIDLVGDVTITDRIFVGSSTTSQETGSANPAEAVLEIYNATDHDVRIKAYVWSNTNGSNVIFSVWENAKLIIHGKPGARIIIDGNGGITHPITNDTGTTVTHHQCDGTGAWDGTRWGLIESTGTLDFEYVTIENVRFNRYDYTIGTTQYSNMSDGDCAVIKLNPWMDANNNKGNGKYYTQKTTTFRHCIFRNIRNEDNEDNYAGYASVLTTYGNAGQRSENNRTTCKITFDDCEIYDVKQNGHTKQMRYGTEAVDNDDGSAGLIRFRGSWPGDMDLINTKIHDNYSKYDCAGVLWNAIGGGNPSNMPLLTVNGCKFYNNKTDNDAGALRLEGNFTFSGNQSEFYGNTAGRGGAIQIWGYSGGDAITQGTLNQYINDCVYCHNNTANQGGALYICYDSPCSLPNGMNINTYLDGCIFENNTANWQGGAICLNNSQLGKWNLKLYLDKATFTGNNVTSSFNGSTSGGGALHTWNFNVEARSGAAGCTFTNNKSNYWGGAIFAEGTSTVTLDNLTFTGNESDVNGSYGGAIFGTGGNVYFDVKTVNIDKLVSSTSGGGIYLKDGARCKISNATITNCKSNGSGGGIHLQNGSSLEIVSGKINNNYANGGTGGGVCAIGSSFTMGNGEINDNKASSHGGGVYFTNDVSSNASAKTFRFSGGSISNNKSGGFGGGVCLYTGETTGSTFELTGGNISNNTAANGGGIYLNAWGQYAIPLQNTNIEHNTAYLGGGVLMYNGTLNYKKGLIRYNKAIARTGNSKPSTMYQVNHCINSGGDAVNPDLSGIGGGIYATWGIINLDTSEGFGVYSNTADFGADDLFANAQNNATVDMPNPTSMTITGFDVPTSSLYWFEDYVEGDSNFGKKPSNAGAGPNRRYRDLLYERSSQLTNSRFTPGRYSDYIMAALGYNFVYGTLKKSGLKEGETTIINIYRGEISTMVGAQPYVQVPLTGDKNGNATRKIFLQPGTWTVVESTWSWTYKGTAEGDGVKTVDGQPAITRELIETSDENLRTFSFTNEKQKSAPNAESIKKNDNMKK